MVNNNNNDMELQQQRRYQRAGELISMARQKLSLSQVEASKLVARVRPISEAAYSRLERGETLSALLGDAVLVRALRDVLDVDIIKLLETTGHLTAGEASQMSAVDPRRNSPVINEIIDLLLEMDRASLMDATETLKLWAAQQKRKQPKR